MPIAATPAMMNITCQPATGISVDPRIFDSRVDSGLHKASAAIIRPRRRAGMNSISVAAATTTSAPNPTLMRKRSAISQFMFGAAAAASENRPKISRLI